MRMRSFQDSHEIRRGWPDCSWSTGNSLPKRAVQTEQPGHPEQHGHADEHGQREADEAGFRPLPGLGQAVAEDRDDEDVVHAQHQVEADEQQQGGQGVGERGGRRRREKTWRWNGALDSRRRSRFARARNWLPIWRRTRSRIALMIDMLVRLYDLPESEPVPVRETRRRGDCRAVARCVENLVAAWAGKLSAREWRSEVEVASRGSRCRASSRRGEADSGIFVLRNLRPRVFRPDGCGRRPTRRRPRQGRPPARARGAAPHRLRVRRDWRGRAARLFYARTVGAIEIPGSDLGIYRDILPG